MKERTIKQYSAGHRANDGAGVELVRVLGNHTAIDFDPFLMLDAFDSHNPKDYIAGFPMHPHRGIETFTYLIKGDIEHQDSLGHKGSIRDGACQWMTAGRGIMHQEMPKACPHMLGLQLWINLPKKDKMTTPKYGDIEAQMIPEIKETGANIKVVAGRYKGVDGGMQGSYVDVQFLDVKLEPNAVWQLETKPGDTVFAYIFEGKIEFGKNGDMQPEKQAILFEGGDYLTACTGAEGAHFIVASGKPLHEPIAWGGPIVMNTQEEVERAFVQIRFGTFVSEENYA